MSDPTEAVVPKKARSEKSRPLEFSCRSAVAVPKPQRQGLLKRAPVEEFVDPRFNREIAGEFNSHMFGKAYGFLNDYREAEKKDIVKRLQSKKLSHADQEDLKLALTRMTSQDAARSRISTEAEIRRELKQKELEAVAKTGKSAYIHPRSEIKRIMKEREESEMRRKGTFEKTNAKREKRKIAEEKKSSGIPKHRRIVDTEGGY